MHTHKVAIILGTGRGGVKPSQFYQNARDQMRQWEKMGVKTAVLPYPANLDLRTYGGIRQCGDVAVEFSPVEPNRGSVFDAAEAAKQYCGSHKIGAVPPLFLVADGELFFYESQKRLLEVLRSHREQSEDVGDAATFVSFGFMRQKEREFFSPFPEPDRIRDVASLNLERVRGLDGGRDYLLRAGFFIFSHHLFERCLQWGAALEGIGQLDFDSFFALLVNPRKDIISAQETGRAGEFRKTFDINESDFPLKQQLKPLLDWKRNFLTLVYFLGGTNNFCCWQAPPETRRQVLEQYGQAAE